MPKLDIFLSPLLVESQKREYDKFVVIDLFRATTAFCTAINFGIKEIMPFSDVEQTRKMRDKGFLIAGERNGNKLEGFDFGNSPFDFMSESLCGRSLAFTTTNGTKCIDIVKDKGEVLIASFNNISTLTDYLKKEKKDVALVCSGWKGMPNIEDSICAGAVAYELLKCGFEPVEDSVNICVDLYINSQDNELDYIVAKSTRVASRMRVLGDDFRQCLEKDIYKVLPKLDGDKIINII
jgi:2-phosphosulfolactate phosphatase